MKTLSSGLRHRFWKPLFCGFAVLFVGNFWAIAAASGQGVEPKHRCVIVEVFVDQDRELDDGVEEFVKKFSRERGGLLLAIRKLQDGEAGAKRLEKITSHYKIEPADRPVLYCFNRVIYGKATVAEYRKALEEALEVEVYVRTGCSRCAAAKRFLPGYFAEYPALHLSYWDISQDSASVEKLNQLVVRHQQAATSVPVIHVCDSLQVGFSSEQTSRSRLDAVLHRWTKECPAAKQAKPKDKPSQESPPGTNARLQQSGTPEHRLVGVVGRHVEAAVPGVAVARPF